MPSILQNHYVLAVHDAEKSAEFYIDKLGFKKAFDGGGWIFVEKDHCMIMIGECPGDMHPKDLGCHNYFAYLVVDDADAYYESLRAKEVKFISSIEDKPWDMREFGIETCDGHRIMIGQTINTKEK